MERYSGQPHPDYRGQRYVDIEPARVLATPTPGVGPLLQEAWDRYRLPMAVTEAHIDARREDQMRWLVEIWQAASKARQHGIDMRAVTVWAFARFIRLELSRYRSAGDITSRARSTSDRARRGQPPWRISCRTWRPAAPYPTPC